MRFLCDKMLVRLGRWLRAAGYDTAIVESEIKDREILEWAIREERHLITRDRHFLNIARDYPYLLYFRGNSLSECLQELNNKVNINWQFAPFTRCMLCNCELTVATEEEKRLVPEQALNSYNDFWYCQVCKKVYWLGSHTHKMLEVLKNM